MSWSVSVPPGPLDEFETRAAVAKVAVPDQFELQEAKDAYKAAVRAASDLAGGLGVGPEDHISVQLSGHANPDHKPKEGWSPDTVYVSVLRVHEPA